MDGFSAVVTTGIYCRPGCSARPDPRNVRRFGLAAAAEAAGFRACLRCRPYRADPPTAWISGPELVCRAVRLVLGGALDGHPETELASRLGVSDRHLRRLFSEHLGVTPGQLARSRVRDFARRLLDDTDLSVTQVAYAAGFGSVRQLNRACADIFRAPPAELRSRRRASDRLVADGGLVLRLPYSGELDWDGCSPTSLRGRSRASSGSTAASTGGPCSSTATPACSSSRRGATTTCCSARALPHWEGLIHLVARARHVFNLDASTAEAARRLAADPLVGDLVAQMPGIRPPGAWDPFETGIRAIVGQQVSIAGAGTLMARIVERLGTAVPGLGRLGLALVFPTPATLAGADLGGLGLTTSRGGNAIRAFASAVAAGDVVLDRAANLERLVGSIAGVRGLGPWTAQYLALRLGEPDAFPASDLGLRRALSRIAGHPVGPSEAQTIAERWRPWRAHAATALWFSRADRVEAARSA